MSMEEAGGAITGALAASAVSRRKGAKGQPSKVCRDCGQRVSGKFCSNCGQPTHAHRTLIHLGEELLHGVMHFDARIWRTLPLLAFNPGRLTREWIEGKRTRYVSPLAMFLFTVFVIFFALSFAHAPQAVLNPEGREALMTTSIQIAEENVGDAEKALAEASARPASAERDAAVTEARTDLAENQQDLADRREALARFQADPNAMRADGLTPGGWQAQIKDFATEITKSDGADHSAKMAAKKLQNPDLAVYKLQQTFYKFAFLLVPFSIPFMGLLFVHRRKVTLYDHGVFVLYSLTFMSMLGAVVGLVVALNSVAGTAAWMIASLLAPVHIFAQLKGTYSLSWFSTIWRFVFLIVFCNIIIVLFVTAVIWLGLGL